jgi:ABC-2 type transport system ATP-binding protein
VVPDNLTDALHRLTGWAIEHRIELETLQIVRPSLEDVYLALTGPPPPASDDTGGDGAHGRRSRRRSRQESA